MLAAVLFAAHLTTVSFTHPCASAEEVLFALGQKLGMQLEPTGSVKKDYFLVRVKDQEPQVVLDRIAKTLDATWTERDSVRFLGRTHEQELRIATYGHDALHKAIDTYLAKAGRPRTWTREQAKEFLRPFIKTDGALDQEKTEAALTDRGPYRDLLNEFARTIGPEALSSFTPLVYTSYRWQSGHGDRLIPVSFRARAEGIAKSVQAFGEAFRELGVRAPFGYGQLGPEAWSFGVQSSGLAVSVFVVASGTNPQPFGSLSIACFTTPEQFAGLSGLESPYRPTSLAMNLSIAFERARTFSPSEPRVDKDLLDWFDRGFPTDPLQLIGGEPIIQAAEAANLNVVAVLPDDLVVLGSFRSNTGMRLQELLTRLLASNVVELQDGWLIARHSLAVGARERFDRRALASFALEAKKDGWQRIEPLAELATKCDGYHVMWSALRLAEAINPAQSRFRMIEQIRFDLLNVFAMLPPAAKRSARNGGVTWQLSEMPSPARDRLIKSLENKDFVKSSPRQSNEPTWPSGLTWMAPPCGGGQVELQQGATVEVRLDSARMFALPDLGRKGLYSAPLMTPEEVAYRIHQFKIDAPVAPPVAPPGYTVPTYDFLALVDAERLTITVRLPNGDSYECGLIVDSQSATAKFLAHATIPGPEGDALREALRKLGG